MPSGPTCLQASYTTYIEDQEASFTLLRGTFHDSIEASLPL